MNKRSLLITAIAIFVIAGLGAQPAAAYYDDIHYNLTYYIARQVGYTPMQAHRIASATVSVDWSPATEPVQASFRVENRVLVITPFAAPWAMPSSQEPRWRYHAFRNDLAFSDAVGPGRDADVADMQIRQQQLALWNQALEMGNPGIFMHFFQDVVPHAKYGTRNGHWPVSEKEDVERHQRFGLPIGGTPDWLSYQAMAVGEALVQQTASSLTTFMERVSPKQRPRQMDAEATMALMRALRDVNPFPTSLQGKSIDALRRGKAYSLLGTLSAEAAIGFFANQYFLDPQETENIIRQFHGPALPPALEKVNAAMARSGWRPTDDVPFETLPEFVQYDFDGFGRMRNPADVTKWVLNGKLNVNVKSRAGEASAQKIPVKVVALLAKTRPGDTEQRLGEENSEVNGAMVSFDKTPVGEILIDIYNMSGQRLQRETRTLSGSEQTFDIYLKFQNDLTLIKHKDDVTSVAYSPLSNVVASSSLDKTVIFWDLETAKPMTELGPFPHPIYALAYMPDGSRIAGATKTSDTSGRVMVWDAATGRLLSTFGEHRASVNTLAYSPDSRTLVTADNSGVVMFRNAGNGEPRSEFKAHSDVVTEVEFSPDGKWLASSSKDRTVAIWDTATMQVRHLLRDHDGPVYSVAISSDSKWVASGTQFTTINPNTGNRLINGTVKIWDIATGRMRTKLDEHGHAVFALEFSPTTNILAARSWQGYLPNPARQNTLGTGNTRVPTDPPVFLALDDIVFWNSDTGRVIDVFSMPNEQIMSMSFSTDGRMLAAGGFEDVVRVWSLDRVLDKMARAADVTGLMSSVVVPDAPSQPSRTPKSGELNLSGGKFTSDQWIMEGSTTLESGALSFRIPAGTFPGGRVTSRQKLSGDFDLRIAYALEEFDNAAGSTFEIALLGQQAGFDFLLSPTTSIPAPPSVRISRTGFQGRDFYSIATDNSNQAQGGLATGREGTLRIERKGADWTISRLDAASNAWTQVGRVTRQLGADVEIQLRAEKNGNSPLRVIARSIQATLLGP
jgi:WD40 repeat protein